MTISANCTQWIWTPLLGWAVLSMAMPAALAQAPAAVTPGDTTTSAPADVTVVPGGAVPPAGPTGQLPPYTGIPGTSGAS